MRINRARDPDGRLADAATSAQLWLDEAVRRRRFWTALLGALGAPACLVLAYPPLAQSELRLLFLVFWPACMLGLLFNVGVVVRCRRRLSAIEAELRADWPADSGAGAPSG